MRPRESRTHNSETPIRTRGEETLPSGPQLTSPPDQRLLGPPLQPGGAEGLRWAPETQPGLRRPWRGLHRRRKSRREVCREKHSREPPPSERTAPTGPAAPRAPGPGSPTPGSGRQRPGSAHGRPGRTRGTAVPSSTGGFNTGQQF